MISDLHPPTNRARIFFDLVLRDVVTRQSNVPLDDRSLNQATIPVCYGVFEIRKTGDIALSTFISSMPSINDRLIHFSEVKIVADTEEKGAI